MENAPCKRSSWVIERVGTRSQQRWKLVVVMCGGQPPSVTLRHSWALGQMDPPKFFYYKILVLCITNFNNFCSIKLYFASLNNIINSFKSNVIDTNFSTKMLQTVEVTISY